MRLGRFITHVSCWVPQSRLAAWVREDLTGRQVTWVHHLSLLHIFWRPAKHLIFGPSFHLEKERTITGNLYWLRPYEHFRRQVDSAWQTKASWSEWVFFFLLFFFSSGSHRNFPGTSKNLHTLPHFHFLSSCRNLLGFWSLRLPSGKGGYSSHLPAGLCQAINHPKTSLTSASLAISSPPAAAKPDAFPFIMHGDVTSQELPWEEPSCLTVLK